MQKECLQLCTITRLEIKLKQISGTNHVNSFVQMMFDV